MKLRNGWLAVAAVALLAAGPQDGAKKDDAKKDADALQGEWTVVSMEVNGEKVPEERAKSLRRIVKGDDYTVERDGQPAGKGKFTLGADKTPKTIDVAITFPEEAKDKKVLGIYKIDGDTFTMCYAPPDSGERPKEFASPAESGIVLTVWKKVKK